MHLLCTFIWLLFVDADHMWYIRIREHPSRRSDTRSYQAHLKRHSTHLEEPNV